MELGLWPFVVASPSPNKTFKTYSYIYWESLVPSFTVVKTNVAKERMQRRAVLYVGDDFIYIWFLYSIHWIVTFTFFGLCCVFGNLLTFIIAPRCKSDSSDVFRPKIWCSHCVSVKPGNLEKALTDSLSLTSSLCIPPHTLESHLKRKIQKLVSGVFRTSWHRNVSSAVFLFWEAGAVTLHPCTLWRWCESLELLFQLRCGILMLFIWHIKTRNTTK